MNALLALLLACGGSAETPPAAPAPDAPAAAPAPAPAAAPPEGEVGDAVDIAELKARLDAGQVPVLVDVRTQQEWDSGHVPGAVHIPMNEIQARQAEIESYKDGPVYFICASGNRSGRVSAQMRKVGYHAVNVEGGTSAWKAAGHPVE